jgi:hypothetical protein
MAMKGRFRTGSESHDADSDIVRVDQRVGFAHNGHTDSISRCVRFNSNGRRHLCKVFKRLRWGQSACQMILARCAAITG